jgi:hypothetical protein
VREIAARGRASSLAMKLGQAQRQIGQLIAAHRAAGQQLRQLSRDIELFHAHGIVDASRKSNRTLFLIL